MTLTFGRLRWANTARLPLFRNRAGEIAHAKADGSDWSPNDWMVAVVGEVGEAANLLKKMKRGDFDTKDALDAARAELEKELADIVIYLDLLAFQLGVELDSAVVQKFNEVSRRVGCAVFL